MPGPKPCPPDCACGHHKRPKQPVGEYRRKQREAARARRAADPELREQEREYAAERRLDLSVRERARAWERGRSVLRRFARHGLTAEQFMLLFGEQCGACYLCGKPLSLERSAKGKQKIHVDHDHSCCPGIESCGDCVRGLACPACNHAIGVFGDSPERMERAAAALRAANARVAERIAARPFQAELPLNVTPIKRAAEGG